VLNCTVPDLSQSRYAGKKKEREKKNGKKKADGDGVVAKAHTDD